MAARLNARHQEIVRQKIKASQLLNFVQSYALGKPLGKNNYGVYPGPQEAAVRIKAALGLLAKCLPDLQRTELTGQEGSPLEVKIVRFSDATEPVDASSVSAARMGSARTGLPPSGSVLASQKRQG